jgi:lipopolysaccharide biosynthesis protein
MRVAGPRDSAIFTCRWKSYGPKRYLGRNRYCRHPSARPRAVEEAFNFAGIERLRANKMALRGARAFGSRLLAYSRHVGEKVGTVTLGALFVSGPTRKLRNALGRLQPPAPVPAIRTAVIAHVFYPDQVPEILACWSLIPGNADLHVTTTEDRREAVLRALAGRDNFVVHITPNRGRDIAAFLAAFNSGILDKYDAVLKLHTKSSPHLWDGGLRRKLLFQTLCGSKQSALRTISMFADATTGMIGWGFSFRSTPRFWFANEARVRALAARMNALDAVRPGFFEGSMFWFRPLALNRLKSLNLTADDFEAESGQLDGTLHHAIERLFTIAAWSSGYVVRDLHGRLLPRK